jgi:hypothetical protein
LRSAVCLLVLTFFFSGWALAASALHVVYTPATLSVVTKQGLSFTDTYVDTRQWTMEDAAGHPVLVRRLIELRRPDMLGHIEDIESPLTLEEQLLVVLERGNSSGGGVTTLHTVQHRADQASAGLRGLLDAAW